MASAPVSGKSRVTSVLDQHPGIILLVVAAILGLILLPAGASAMMSHDVMIGGQVSTINAVWLVVALALGTVCLVARSGPRRDLGNGIQQLIAGARMGDTTLVRRAGATEVDTATLGAVIARGIFDLVILLVIQGILRTPLVAVVSVYEPKALVDGAFVVLVVLIALLMLFGLYRSSRPLTEYLVAAGLDRLVPTAGFAAGNLPDLPAPPTTGRTTSAPGASRATAQPTIAAGSVSSASDQPTIAAAPTMVAPAEATVMAPSESTILAPDEATIVAPSASEATVIESDQTIARDETVLEESPSDESRRNG